MFLYSAHIFYTSHKNTRVNGSLNIFLFSLYLRETFGIDGDFESKLNILF